MKGRMIVYLAAIIFLAASILTYFFYPFGFLAGIVPVQTNGSLPLETIRLPKGFSIETYAYPVPGARSLALSPSGTVYVGTRGEGNVYALIDANKDGKAEQVVTVASGLDTPNGVAFMNGSLYVAETTRIIRFDSIEENLRNASYRVIYDKYPADTFHGWKYMAFGPDGKLYVPVGSPCNLCVVQDPYAAITRMDADGSNYEVFARGIRNTVGFDWDPNTKEMWFTDNGRDLLGEDIPPDELDHAPSPRQNFGYPYCYGMNVPDPAFGRDCSNYTPSALDLGAHVASLGMKFYDDNKFPDKYTGGIFIAEHGSWDRKIPTGYRVVYVPFTSGMREHYEIFAEGWLQNGIAWGRPVDVLVMPDGSLLVSDDKAGAVYRIKYDG